MVAGDGGEAEEEEVDGGEDVGGGEGGPVGGEVGPQLLGLAGLDVLHGFPSSLSLVSNLP